MITTELEKAKLTRLAVDPGDRVVLDAICGREKRTLSAQFSLILDRYCEVEGINRQTGEKLKSNGRKKP